MSAPQTEVLVFVDGREIARHLLRPGLHVFGRAESCDICVDAVRVSPEHAWLLVGDDGSVLLTDLGNAHGTFLDGQTVTAPTPVAPNQMIQIGTAQILLLQLAAHAPEDSTIATNGSGAPPALSPSIRYEIGEEIAKGGMGTILAARQPSIRRDVALKVMLRDASDRDRLRFIEEAQITGQLEHPNIVPVHELAINEQGKPYYTMKLVKGSTLKAILKLLAQNNSATVARYPLAALLTIFQKVCDAAAFAHAKGVIHRDLKPANIMVGDYGEVLLMDWGLAKVVCRASGGRDGSPGRPSALGESGSPMGQPPLFPAAASALPTIATIRDDESEVFATIDGAVMGTPQYMSPEQARGEVTTLDERSDLFSLGAILYELVTLLPPFPGKTTREILSKIKSGYFILPNARLRATDTPHPHHLPGSAIPDSLEAIILKALTLDREQRYQRVADFQADLTAYQGGFATSAENAGAWKQFKLFIARHKGISTAVAASLLLLAIISFAFTMRVIAERNRAEIGERTAQEARRLEAEQRKIADEKKTQAEAANAENLQHLHEASMADYGAAVQRIEEDNRWHEGVAHVARAVDLESTNAFAATYLYSTIVFQASSRTNRLRQVLPCGDEVRSASFSPDGKRIVTASEDTTAALWDATTGKRIGKVMSHAGRVFSASFSPDGKNVLTWSGPPISEDDTSVGTVGATDGRAAQVFDGFTGEAVTGRIKPGGQIAYASFSAEGKIILTASGNIVQLWDAATGKPIGMPLRHQNTISAANLSSDGKRIVTETYDKKNSELREAHLAEAQVWDLASGKRLGQPIHYKTSVNPQFSPDGKRILTGNDDGSAVILRDAATGKPLGIPMKCYAYFASFSPDGMKILTQRGSGNRVPCEIDLWDANTNQQLGTPISPEGGRIWSATFSPDSRWVVTGDDSASARVWDATTGASVGEPMRHENDSRILSVSFSPDGTQIVTAGSDGTARIWDAPTSKPLGEPIRFEGPIEHATFNSDGKLLVTRTLGGKVPTGESRLWDIASGKPIGGPMKHAQPVGWSICSPDGTRIVTGSGVGFDNGTDVDAINGESVTGIVEVWDATTCKQVATPIHFDGTIEAVVFSPGGARILTATEDHVARVWDAATGQALAKPLHHESAVTCADFSPDGSYIVTANGTTVQVRDALTAEPIWGPIRSESWLNVIEGVCFSPDGKWILTMGYHPDSDNPILQRWDALTGKPVAKAMQSELAYLSEEKPLKSHEMRAHLSPDGKRIFTLGPGRLWDTATGEQIGARLRDSGIKHASFSPDSKWIVTTAQDMTEEDAGRVPSVRLWETKTGKPIGERMRQPTMLPLGWWKEEELGGRSFFSPDGMHIVTVNLDTDRWMSLSYGMDKGDTRKIIGDADTARIWEVKSLLNLPTQTPAWVHEWAYAVAGFEFDEDGLFQPIPVKERLRILSIPHPGDDPWSRLAQWLATAPAKRTTHPDSTHTFREIAEWERDFGSHESLESALRYDTTVPLARLLLAGALLRDNAVMPPDYRAASLPQHAASLRDYDLQRLPDDPALWERAVRSLHDQKDDEGTRQAWQKLDKLAPEKAAALRKELAL